MSGGAEASDRLPGNNVLKGLIIALVANFNWPQSHEAQKRVWKTFIEPAYREGMRDDWMDRE